MLQHLLILITRTLLTELQLEQRHLEVPISIGHTTSETTVNDNLVVTGDIDLEGSIDVNGTANLDGVDIDGAVDMASTTSS